MGMLVYVYRDNAMEENISFIWLKWFPEGQECVTDDERSE